MLAKVEKHMLNCVHALRPCSSIAWVLHSNQEDMSHLRARACNVHPAKLCGWWTIGWRSILKLLLVLLLLSALRVHAWGPRECRTLSYTE